MSEEEKYKGQRLKRTPIQESAIAGNKACVAVFCQRMYIIDCLPDSERSFDTNIRQQVIDIHNAKKYMQWGMCYIRVSDAAGLLKALSLVCEQATERIPLIHFEAHGDPVKGLEVSTSSEFVDWKTLSDQLRKINLACRGFLGVVAASCYGFRLAQDVDIKKPSPFSFLLASPETPTIGYLQENFPGFYKTLFETRNLDAACVHFAKGKESNSMLPLFLLFTVENLVAEKFLEYLRENCSAKDRNGRVNDMITRYRGDFGEFAGSKLSEVRKAAKTVTAPDNQISLFKKLASGFLAGRPWLISLEEISETFYRRN
ncbi:hypothetical protein [Variovorax atrisoli]|uniref:hypothetical protein n=1 Tax=Variovorax atrisoli TaxID=3394203 RepID=UPI0012FE3AB7|nr:hypothetical protein [Variovorax paradoxus]